MKSLWSATYDEHKRDPTCGSLLLHFLCNIRAHILILQEGGTILTQDKEAMRKNSWLVAASSDKSLLCAVRANPWPGSYIKHFAGTSTEKKAQGVSLVLGHLRGVCVFGIEPHRESWERACLFQDRVAFHSLLEADNPNKQKIRRCGTRVTRICSLRLKKQYA